MTAKPPAETTLSGVKALLADPRLTAYLNYLLILFTVMTFGLTALLAMLVANFAEDKAPGWIRGHYAFQKRTFWYGIGPVLLNAAAYTFVRKNHITAPAITSIMLLLLLFCLGYTVGRAVMGFNHLLHQRPIPNPKAWVA
jgi:uncharacterized membrane protein